MLPRFKAAAVHAAPVFLDKQATTKKAISLIREAAARQRRDRRFLRDLYSGLSGVGRLVGADRQSRPVRADGRSVGARRRPEIEGDPGRGACCSGSCVSIGYQREFTGQRRRDLELEIAMIGERRRDCQPSPQAGADLLRKADLAGGDGAGLRVVDTQVGRIGQLICGENTNPLARYALDGAGRADAHFELAAGVADPAAPSSGANYDIVAANRIRASAHCVRGQGVRHHHRRCDGQGDRGTCWSQRDPAGGSDVMDRTPRGRVVLHRSERRGDRRRAA